MSSPSAAAADSESKNLVSLTTGETLKVTVYAPESEVPSDKIQPLRDLILQPRTPWISEVERIYLEGALQGRFKDLSRDCFFVGWIDDEPVGNVYYGTAIGATDVGLMAYVLTAPAHRGKGIATILTGRATEHFVAAGGVCMHLGTGNPVAQRAYERCGFRDYNGHVMRYLSPGRTWESFDETHFANIGRAKVRPGHWGDLARVGILYVTPHRWFVKDYAERIYSHPELVQTRCGSILTSMMVNVTARGGGLWVLENGERRVVGAATATL